MASRKGDCGDSQPRVDSNQATVLKTVVVHFILSRREPTRLLASLGEISPRSAARLPRAGYHQLPPRITRSKPKRGPWGSVTAPPSPRISTVPILQPLNHVPQDVAQTPPIRLLLSHRMGAAVGIFVVPRDRGEVLRSSLQGLWSGRSHAWIPCCGENTPAQHPRGAARHCLGTVRSTRSRGKALSLMPLALPSGRPVQEGRSIGGAGATPPKTALACADGPFGKVAPGNSPCRKALRPGGRRA